MLAAKLGVRQRHSVNVKNHARAKSPAIRLVRQRTGTSCGLACIAMLARSKASEVTRILKRRLNDYSSEHTDISDIRFALRQLGLELGRKVASRNWRTATRLQTLGLAAVRHKRLRHGYERWHWVVVEIRKGQPVVWDPARKTGPHVEFDKVPLAWYHHVRIE